MLCKHVFVLRKYFSTKEVLSKISLNDLRPDYDIIISGGGMIGSTLACVLSKNPLLQNKKILLIEGAKKKNWSLNELYSNRVSALNPSTRKLLESVGIWSHIEKARFKPVKQMKVWGSASEAVVEFGGDHRVSDQLYTKDVAYIVENDVLVAAAMAELDKKKDVVTVFHDSKVQQYQFPTACANESISVEMQGGKIYTCSLLLGTDGANSKVRETMNTEYIRWSYGQAAIVATLRLKKVPSNDIAWQRFLTTGPVALLPLNDDLSSLVWSTSTENAKELVGMKNEDFVAALNREFMKPPHKSNVMDLTSQLTDVVRRSLRIESPKNEAPLQPPTVKDVIEGSRASFPLGFGHSSSYVRTGVALLGDAAHKVHPLAGQGVNLGFGDIATLNRLLSQAVTNGNVINSISMLKQYEKERLRHNLPTMLAIDLINKLYSNSNTVLMTAGHLAIQVANYISPIKDVMVKQASS